MPDLLFDQAHNVLIYPALPAGARQLIAQHIPEAREFNGSSIAVPRSLRASQVLRWLGHPVVPVMDGYDWPCPPGISPWEHQKLAANFAVLHPRSFNLSDLGSGKTFTLLWASDFIMRQHESGKYRTLIVAPLSTLRSVWAKAVFETFLNRRTFAVLHGTAEKRIAGLEQDVDYYIVNHDGVGVGAHTRKKFELDGFSKALAEREDIRIAIVDEASAYKDATTKRHRIARQVLGKRDYLFLLTGTPTPQAPTEAYGLAKLVNNAFGRSFSTFQQETMTKVSQFRWVPQKDGYQKAKQLLTPAIRFDINDVWKNAPELTIQSREVELTKEQTALMTKLKNELQIIIKSGQQISIANEAALRSKFLQLSLGAVYDSDHKTHFIDASPRISVLKEVLDQSPRKVLLLASFTSVLTLLAKELKSYHCEVVNGAVSQKERTEIFRRFQDEVTPEIIIADPGVLAHGLNLQRGRTIIWFSPVDKTELFQQANARCHRPGQKFPVAVIQLVSNPLEREIYKRLASNASLQGALLGMVARGEL